MQDNQPNIIQKQIQEQVSKFNTGDEVIFLGYKTKQEDHHTLHVGDELVVLDGIKGTTYTVAVAHGRRSQAGTTHMVYADEIDHKRNYKYHPETDWFEYIGVQPQAEIVPDNYFEDSTFTQVKTYSKEVIDIINSGEDIVEVAKNLYLQAQKNIYTLGGLLLFVHQNKIHEKYGYSGYKGFEAFCESIIGAKYGSARHYINVYQKYTNLEVPVEQIEQIGFTKARTIMPVVTKENLNELMEYSASHTVEEIKDHIKYKYRKTNTEGQVISEVEGEQPTYTKIFKFFEEDSKALDLALKIVKGNTPIESNTEALVFIIRHFLNSNLGREAPVADVLNLIELFYGIKVQVVKG